MVRRGCYIAGPMRSKPQFNYPAFFAAEEALRAAGWSVIFNPARMDLGAGEDTPLHLSKSQQEALAGAPAQARRYAKRDLGVLVDYLRAEDGDAIVFLPDWEQSTGARAERAVAIWVGLPVLTLEEATRDE